MEQQQVTGRTSPGQQPWQQAAWPQDAYGVVVDDRLASAVIRLGLDRLMARKDPDQVVFLCLAPHDVRQRTDWEDLQQHVRSPNGKQVGLEVRILNSPHELLDASMEMRVIRLPADASTMGY